MPITVLRQLPRNAYGHDQWEVQQGDQILVMTTSQLVWAMR